MSTVSILAALQLDNGIGRENDLPWRIPADLKRFKELTLGHPVVMGRKTFESIEARLGKPLPGRSNVVLTHDRSWSREGVTVAHSFEEAIERARTLPGADEIFVIGGNAVFASGMSLADRLLLTEVHANEPCDAFFPAFKDSFPVEVSRELGETDDGLRYAFVEYRRA